jgi:hypothetical protein
MSRYCPFNDDISFYTSALRSYCPTRKNVFKVFRYEQWSILKTTHVERTNEHLHAWNSNMTR